MGATENTSAGRNQLTSPEDRGIMLLANVPVNLEDGNNMQPIEQATVVASISKKSWSERLSCVTIQRLEEPT